jgi:hypothetical protein
MFEKIKQKITPIAEPTNTEINPETGVLSVNETLGQDPNQNGGLPVMSAETIKNAQPPDSELGARDPLSLSWSPLYTLLDSGECAQVTPDIIYPAGTKFYFRREDGTYYDSEIEIGPDAPVAQTKPKVPLAEAESLLAWLKTQPSTPENRAMRAQAGIVVDYLKGE